MSLLALTGFWKRELSEFLAASYQRKTKGQQLKGKIVSALFHTFWHFSTHFHTFFQSFSEFFLQDFFLELRSFTTVSVQRDEKRIKENKKKKTKPFCTLVVARLSCSDLIRVRQRTHQIFMNSPSLAKNSESLSFETVLSKRIFARFLSTDIHMIFHGMHP